MVTEIPTYFREYLQRELPAWQERFSDITTLEQLLSRLKEQDRKSAEELLGVGIGYVSEITNEISIYQEALSKLRAGQKDEVVDEWLALVGFTVDHNKLGQALIRRVANLFQRIVGVIQAFIQNIAQALSMTLDEINFTFSVSPSVSLKFK